MYFRYLGRELRRRARSATVVAVGLALAIGLVITVTAAAAGVTKAQGQVLRSLYGVGTAITVTETPTAGGGGGFRFGGAPPTRAQQGKAFSRDRLSSSGGLSPLKASAVSDIAHLRDVEGATGSLSLTSIHVTGTFSGGPGGGSGSGAASSTPFSITTFTVAGVNADEPGLGPLSAGNVTAGAKTVASWFKKVRRGSSGSAPPLALVASSYAKQHSLKAGSPVTISGTAFTVLGLVRVGQAASPADIYLPLSQAQRLAGDTGKVNTIYVEAMSASDVSAVQSQIQHLMPKATVTTAQELASQVTGSIGTAATLADSLGFWLAALVLVAAFVLAALLTTASVNRRVREFGTLKAMGWRSRRIVGQVVGESLAQGLVGALVGIGLGVVGAFLVTKFAPALHATAATAIGATPRGRGGFAAGGPPGGTGGGGAARRAFIHNFAPTSHSIPLHLTAPISLAVFGIAVGLALAGALIAGALGGWRASRLQPAEALRRVE